MRIMIEVTEERPNQIRVDASVEGFGSACETWAVNRIFDALKAQAQALPGGEVLSDSTRITEIGRG